MVCPCDKVIEANPLFADSLEYNVPHDKSLLFKGLNGLDIRCAQTYGDNSLLVGGVGVMYILTNDLQLSKCISPMGALIVETIYVDYPENRIWIGCEGSGVWIYEKGHLSQIQGDFNSAIDFFNKAYIKDPTASTLASLANCMVATK